MPADAPSPGASAAAEGRAAASAASNGPRRILNVVADRFRIGSAEKVRAIEAIELALKRGAGRVNVYVSDAADAEPELWRYSTGLHCPDSELHYADPQPSMFSFNSPAGACETCRGFGRANRIAQHDGVHAHSGQPVPDRRRVCAVAPGSDRPAVRSQRAVADGRAGAIAAPLALCGVLKIGYDLALWRAFRRHAAGAE
jgi:hypothetical protein